MSKLVKMLQAAAKDKKYVNVVLGNGHTYGGIPTDVDVKGNCLTLDNSPHAVQAVLLDLIIIVQLPAKGKGSAK